MSSRLTADRESLIASMGGTNDVTTPHKTRAAAATAPITTAQRRGERPSRFISFKGEKSSMVVLWQRAVVTP